MSIQTGSDMQSPHRHSLARRLFTNLTRFCPGPALASQYSSSSFIYSAMLSASASPMNKSSKTTPPVFIVLMCRIMRVSMLIPVYSLFSFLSVIFPNAGVYLLPWLDVFQANSLCAFFLLMCTYISPHDDQRDMLFAAMTLFDKKKGQIEGLSWYRVRFEHFGYPSNVLETLGHDLSIPRRCAPRCNLDGCHAGCWCVLPVRNEAIFRKAMGMSGTLT